MTAEAAGSAIPLDGLYLSAIARLSAGLRDVQHACERGDASHAIAPVAAAALADVDRLQIPQPAPETAAVAEIGKHRTRLALLIADTPFEFRPDWAAEYDDAVPRDGLVHPAPETAEPDEERM